MRIQQVAVGLSISSYPVQKCKHARAHTRTFVINLATVNRKISAQTTQNSRELSTFTKMLNHTHTHPQDGDVVRPAATLSISRRRRRLRQTVAGSSETRQLLDSADSIDSSSRSNSALHRSDILRTEFGHGLISRVERLLIATDYSKLYYSLPLSN